MPESLTIGRLAKAAGVNVETVRYYQRRGLVDEPKKPPGGQRRYAVDVVAQLGFIRRAQQLGFSLEEVKALQKVAAGGDCREARKLAEEKERQLKVRMEQLAEMQRKLRRYVEQCAKKGGRGPCPFIAALEEDDKA